MIRSGLRLDTDFDTGSGVPPGSIMEIVGPPDSGKNALALRFMGFMTDLYEDVVGGWIGTEAHLDIHHLRWAGVDMGRLIVALPSHQLGALEIASDLVAGGCDLVVVDSLASAGSDPGDSLMTTLGKHLRRLRQSVTDSESVVILLNQERSRVFHRGIVSTGVSPALLRSCDYRIHLRSGIGYYRGGVQIGCRLHYTLLRNGSDMKNWGRRGSFNCSYQTGLLDIRRRTMEFPQSEGNDG